MVGLSGFEPLTSRLSAVRSSQLSYRPVVRQRPAGLPRSGGYEGQAPKELRPARRPGGWLPENWVGDRRDRREGPGWSFRKEVIQPQVLLQLPCYDFTPITDHTVGACLPYGLAQRLLVQPAFVM